MIDLLTTEELAELLRVSPNRVLLLVRRGEIPTLRVCGKIRFDANDIQGWLEQLKVRQGCSGEIVNDR